MSDENGLFVNILNGQIIWESHNHTTADRVGDAIKWTQLPLIVH